MTEIELKFPVSSHQMVRQRLDEGGAGFVGRFEERNWIFDHRDGSLREQGCGLRVRQAVDADTGESCSTLTFKGPRASGPFKVREEIEIEVGDAERMVQVLGLLGLTPVLEYRKRRESWQMGNCRVELDEPARIGRFVEIEGPDTAAIRKVQAEIGLEDAAVEDSSYVELLIRYCQEQGLKSRILD